MALENIKEDLEKTFPFLQGAVSVPRPRRIFVDVDAARVMNVFDHVVRRLGFSSLSAITGLDGGETLGVIYHLNTAQGDVLSLKTHLPRTAPDLRTVTGTFPGADIYERELIDLLGIRVKGLMSGPRYPLPDSWPAGEFPLRKDWKQVPHQGKTEDSSHA
jgi:Ni,Fe-hydrogenase III component G